MQRSSICRPTLLFQSCARGKSKDSGSASQSNSFTTRCPAPKTFSTNSAISDATSPRQLFVLQPMRDDGILPQPAHLVLLVILEIAFEPFDMAVALEGEHVG